MRAQARTKYRGLRTGVWLEASSGAEAARSEVTNESSGRRASKLFVPGAVLGELPGAEAVEGLAR